MASRDETGTFVSRETRGELVNPAYDSDGIWHGKRRGKETRIKGCCVAVEKEELREHWGRGILWAFKGMILSS